MVMRERGATRFGDTSGYVTIHPSFLLRIREAEDKRAEYDRFVADLRAIARLMATAKAA